MNTSGLFSVEGKTVFITGASRGIGQSLALGFADAGAFVICASSKEGGCNETVAAIQKNGGTASSTFFDLSNATNIATAVNLTLEKHDVDIVINNGGIISRYPAQEYPIQEFQKVIDVNLNATFLICQIFGREMLKRQQGKIINIASMLSYTGGLGVPAYTSSKHAVAGLTKALANEWAEKNIQVNAIAPGYFATDNTEALRENAKRNAEIQKRIPCGKWGQPNQLVGAALFLASPASDYVNGHILAVDGGWLAR